MRQLTPTQSKYIEKVMHDSTGRLVRVTFCVYENGGRVKARVVSAIVLKEITSTSQKTFALPGFIAQTFSLFKTSIRSSIVSPFIDWQILYTLGSKPRAPTF